MENNFETKKVSSELLEETSTPSSIPNESNTPNLPLQVLSPNLNNETARPNESNEANETKTNAALDLNSSASPNSSVQHLEFKTRLKRVFFLSGSASSDVMTQAKYRAVQINRPQTYKFISNLVT